MAALFFSGGSSCSNPMVLTPGVPGPGVGDLTRGFFSGGTGDPIVVRGWAFVKTTYKLSGGGGSPGPKPSAAFHHFWFRSAFGGEGNLFTCFWPLGRLGGRLGGPRGGALIAVCLFLAVAAGLRSWIPLGGLSVLVSCEKLGSGADAGLLASPQLAGLDGLAWYLGHGRVACRGREIRAGWRSGGSGGGGAVCLVRRGRGTGGRLLVLGDSPVGQAGGAFHPPGTVGTFGAGWPRGGRSVEPGGTPRFHSR